MSPWRAATRQSTIRDATLRRDGVTQPATASRTAHSIEATDLTLALRVRKQASMAIHSKRRVWLSIAAVLVLALVALRVALPVIVKKYVNKTLNGLDGYSGSVADIGISLWRGAYQIEDLRIVKTGGKTSVPFVSAETIDLSVEWKALLHGSIVAEIELFDPKLNFINAENPQESQSKANKSWTDTVRQLVPFDINRFAIYGGQIHYRDFDAKPRVDVFVQKLDATARNLTNSNSFGKNLYASFDGKAVAMGSGKIGFHGQLDPYAKTPTFEFAFGLDGLQLKQLNPFLRAYANVDAEAGTISLDAEFAASHGRFRGYAKPFIHDLELVNWNDQNKNFFGKLWESAAQLVADVLKNHSDERVATRIPFEGAIDNPSPDIWSTVGGLLKNAFLVSLRRGLEGSIGAKDKTEKISANQ
jgi:Domain of Unknown Function (DUF748)